MLEKLIEELSAGEECVKEVIGGVGRFEIF